MPTLTAKLPHLRLLANKAMWQAWDDAGLNRKSPNEVECIKNLIENALPRIGTAWQRTLNSIGVKASLQGVVCHGHPRVSYLNAKRECELGDFLLVHDHQNGGGGELLTRRAAIVQAKIFHRHGVTAKNPTQLNLYKQWPSFTYTSWPGGMKNLDALHSAASLAGPLPSRRQRDLRQTGSRKAADPILEMLDHGCRYGMIDVVHSRWGDPLTGMNPWRLCSAQSADVYNSKAGLTLGSYLVHLLGGEVGREAPDLNWPTSIGTACHWSLMVMELLSILPASARTMNSSISYIASTPGLVSTGRKRRSSSTSESDLKDGAFGIIQVTTSGDVGELRRRRDTLPVE